MQHGTHARDGEVRLEVLLMIPAEGADAIARAHTEIAQRAGQPRDAGGHIAEACVAGALALEGDDLTVGKHALTAAQDLSDRQRRVLHGGFHRRSSALLPCVPQFSANVTGDDKS